jgi:hypothetical protein
MRTEDESQLEKRSRIYCYQSNFERIHTNRRIGNVLLQQSINSEIFLIKNH